MNDFEKMSLMSKNDQDIKMFGTIREVTDYPKAGAAIKMQIDSPTAQSVMRAINGGEQKYYVALYVINKEQFDKL
jgi:hypothetical protein